ncbi:MAG: hypothetical protein HY314_02015 [Acidobacteria bacterium]|nr:hypothetical protein [Acidobacteriota bacterium]
MTEERIEDVTLRAAIRNHIEEGLWVTNYSNSQAARILGLPLSTLQDKKPRIEVRRASGSCSFLARHQRYAVIFWRYIASEPLRVKSTR